MLPQVSLHIYSALSFSSLPFFFLPSPLSDKLNFAATEASRGVATFSPIICDLALKV